MVKPIFFPLQTFITYFFYDANNSKSHPCWNSSSSIHEGMKETQRDTKCVMRTSVTFSLKNKQKKHDNRILLEILASSSLLFCNWSFKKKRKEKQGMHNILVMHIHQKDTTSKYKIYGWCSCRFHRHGSFSSRCFLCVLWSLPGQSRKTHL